MVHANTYTVQFTLAPSPNQLRDHRVETIVRDHRVANARMNEWMSSPEVGSTQGKKMTPKTARVETKDPQSTTVCLVDLPHSLLCQGVTLFILSPLPSFHLVYLSLVFTHAPRRLLQRTGNVMHRGAPSSSTESQLEPRPRPP